MEDLSSLDDAHSVSAVAVIDLSDGGDGSTGDPHGLLTSSVVVIGGEDAAANDTGGSASDGGLLRDGDEDMDDEDDDDDGCGSQCGHDHGTPTHMIHIGGSLPQRTRSRSGSGSGGSMGSTTTSGFHVTGGPALSSSGRGGAPPPSSPTPSSTASMSTRGGSSSGGGKRKRIVLSIHEKQQVLARLEMGEQPVVISREFGISRQQVSDIKKNKERILAFCIDAKHLSSLKRKTLKATTEFHPGVEQELYRWLIRQRRLGRGVTADALSHKTTDLFLQYAADDAANVSFRSISVWLRYFKRAHGIKSMNEDELAKLPAQFTPAMEMGGAGGGGGGGSSTNGEGDGDHTGDHAPTTMPSSGGIPQGGEAGSGGAAAAATASVDDVSSYMSSSLVQHQQQHQQLQPFLLQNHALSAEYGATPSTYHMLMLSSTTLSDSNASPLPPPPLAPPSSAASTTSSKLQSCVHVAQSLALQLSHFEKLVSEKLDSLGSRVQRLAGGVATGLSSSSFPPRKPQRPPSPLTEQII